MNKHDKKLLSSARYRGRQRGNKPSRTVPKSVKERVRECRTRRKQLLDAVDARASTENSDISSEPMEICPDDKSPGSANTILPYSDYLEHVNVRKEFRKKFEENSFGHVCDICNTLWFKVDLKIVRDDHHKLLRRHFPLRDVEVFLACKCCFSHLNQEFLPTYSTLNGFEYPDKPPHLPKLDLISERLISPIIPFFQIRRLRYGHMSGHHEIHGQIINTPADVNSAVDTLPRDISDDYCINVNIERKQTYKTSHLTDFVNKKKIRVWLEHLCQSPLYKLYDIKIDERFFDGPNDEEIKMDDIFEDASINDCLIAQQQTLMWDEEKYSKLDPDNENLTYCSLFDIHIEELSFPSIYLGYSRIFKNRRSVTPFMMATSELRRADRRGVTPDHLLYVAMKIMRLRVRDSLKIASKYTEDQVKITREQINCDEYINHTIKANLVFFKCIPNSIYYWAEKKKDLIAMIRQYGRPIMFMTLSANEIGWVKLLKLLYKLKNNGNDLSDELLEQMSYIEKCTLVNEDAVTCVIYFNKLVDVILNLLTSKKISPFGKYRVLHYFKRIEFQDCGSPRAHILLWILDAPVDVLGLDRDYTIEMIDNLISVSASEASGAIDLQTHKHDVRCSGYEVAVMMPKCRFEAPFMPCKKTTILIPMKDTQKNFRRLHEKYEEIRKILKYYDHSNMNEFYKFNNINSDKQYESILRAGITRPTVFLKRQPSEKWHNSFNPFIFNVLQSNMHIQLILDEDSCATFVSEYLDKRKRCISDLQRKIRQAMKDNTEFDLVDVIRKMGIDMLNSVEITSQEAAWFLLREPMSRSSSTIAFIPTMWPVERQHLRKIREEMDTMDLEDESADIWKENWFEKYEKRPENFDDITLAQCVANYSVSGKHFSKRKEPRLIRFRNYDMESDLNNYKREMVTLHIPFRNEETEILSELKFIQIYDENEELILSRRKEFDIGLDIEKTMKIRKGLWREERFYDLMRMCNDRKKNKLVHFIHEILSDSAVPFEIFITGLAGCKKNFVIRLLMGIHNRFSPKDNYRNAYITYALTPKIADAINSTIVYTSLKISLSKLLAPLSVEVVQQVSALFMCIKVLIIEEISMISADVLSHVDVRLKQLTKKYHVNFGGINVIFIGDQGQLPPIVRKRKRKIPGSTPWHRLKIFDLTAVMRQFNRMFFEILSKIGNSLQLDANELQLIESRFFTKEEANELCPDGIRLFRTSESVNEYNSSILNSADNKVISIARDIFFGCKNAKEESFYRQKLRKMSATDTGGFPYKIIFVLNKPYMLTTNIDVADGLVSGQVGRLVHIEFDTYGKVTCIWLEFPEAPNVGKNLRNQVSVYVQEKNISRTAVPIVRQTTTDYVDNNKMIVVKRSHFPIIPCCAVTINESQGGTFDEIVYEYDISHSQSLLYIAMSRVRSINKLYIVTSNDDPIFYHGRRASTSTPDLQGECRRLSFNRFRTVAQQVLDFISKERGISILSLKSRSFRFRAQGSQDAAPRNSMLLLLSGTWLKQGKTSDVPNFDCIVKFKKRNERTAGIAIYQNTSAPSITLTPHLAISLRQMEAMNAGTCTIGDICVARCRLDNGQLVSLVVVYISPNQEIDDIIEFIHAALLAYAPTGAALLKKDWGTQPMIMSGIFNVQFSKPESQLLIDFLARELNLKKHNNASNPSTISGTMIDAVFSRHLERITSQTFVSYFSHDKPMKKLRM